MRIARFTHHLMGHRWQTVAFVFAISFVPLLNVMSILVAALVTLRKGILEGAIATIAASLPFLLGPILFKQNSSDQAQLLMLWAGIAFSVLTNILTWLFASMLYRGMSWSKLLQLATLLGVLVVSVVHLAYPDIDSWWGERLMAVQSFFGELAPTVSGVASKNDALAQVENINAMKTVATGAIVAFLIFQAMMQLMVASWWQAVVYSPGSFGREMRSIRLSRLAGLLFMLALALSFFANANNVIFDIMPTVYMLFLVAGLSLIHYFFRLMDSPMAWVWLLLVYAMLVLSLFMAMPMPIVFVSTLALLDVWFDLRNRIKKV